MTYISVDTLLAEAPTDAIREVIKAAARTAPTGDAVVMDVVSRTGGWLDELDADALRVEWCHYNRLTEWPLSTSTDTGPTKGGSGGCLPTWNDPCACRHAAVRHAPTKTHNLMGACRACPCTAFQTP